MIGDWSLIVVVLSLAWFVFVLAWMLTILSRLRRLVELGEEQTRNLTHMGMMLGTRLPKSSGTPRMPSDPLPPEAPDRKAVDQVSDEQVMNFLHGPGKDRSS